MDIDYTQKVINTQDVIATLTQDMAKANAELQGSSPDKFNQAVLKLLQEEIEKAKPAAIYWKYLCPGSHEYTYTNQFPTAIYDNMSEDFLTQLESASIYLSKDVSRSSAHVRIVFHF